MSTWNVRVPVAGEVIVTVDAEDREAAIVAALDAAEAVLTRRAGSERLGEVVDLLPMRQVAVGNVFYGPLDSIDIEEAT